MLALVCRSEIIVQNSAIEFNSDDQFQGDKGPEAIFSCEKCGSCD